MRIDIFHHIIFDGGQLDRIEGKLDHMNADIQKFVQDVKDAFATNATVIQKISADEDVIIQKLTDAGNSATLGDDDKAALAEVLTLAQNQKAQLDAIDSKVPEAPAGGGGTDV